MLDPVHLIGKTLRPEWIPLRKTLNYFSLFLYYSTVCLL